MKNCFEEFMDFETFEDYRFKVFEDEGENETETETVIKRRNYPFKKRANRRWKTRNAKIAFKKMRNYADGDFKDDRFSCVLRHRSEDRNPGFLEREDIRNAASKTEMVRINKVYLGDVVEPVD